MTATYHKYILNFKQPSGTSRGVLTQKETWFIVLNDSHERGVGECGILRGLSVDDRPDFEDKLQWVCKNITKGLDDLLNALVEFPAIQFGLEMAFLSLQIQDEFILFPSLFTDGGASIPINGLIWMGEKPFMKQQIVSKIKDGFSCIKLKIGAIAFNEELKLLKFIRDEFSVKDIELRMDANGAFSSSEALEKLKRLSDFDLHSIEQPIKQGQLEEMARLCKLSPLDIALDEELIGITSVTKKEELLQTIQPQYIILKPSLIGGFKGSDEWIKIAERQPVKWWITSALESNVGLNAIAQWTYTLGNNMPQGLGTGSLFTNNFMSPLKVKKGTLRYDNKINWDFKF